MENETNPIIEILQNFSQNLNSSELNTVQNNDKNNFNISDILNIFSNNSNSAEKNNTFDISNILKIQKIVSAFNRDDERKNLLMTIKPFLRTTRQDNINKYITYLSVLTAFSSLNEKRGEDNEWRYFKYYFTNCDSITSS